MGKYLKSNRMKNTYKYLPQPRYVRLGQIIDVEAVVLDAVAGILGGVDVDVSLGGVEDVGHPDALQIVHVADGVAVAEDDALVHLEPRTLYRYSPECIHFKI